jgi:hypothetical protein
MAQRAIPIKLKRPSHSGDWEESTLRFVFDNREKIVADLLGWLRNDAAMLEKFSRWATWERYVLARLPEPAAVQSTVGERQSTVDVEIDEAQHIEEYFADRLRGLKYFCESERVFIPSMVAADWFNKATNQRATTIGACRSLSQLCSEGRFKSIQPNLDNSKGRGFVWAGSKATGNTTCMDIKARIENQKNEQTQNT